MEVSLSWSTSVHRLFYWRPSTSTDFHWRTPDSTDIYRLLLTSTSTTSTNIYWLPLTYWLPPTSSGFYWLPPTSTDVLLASTDVPGFHRLLLRSTGFYWLPPTSSGFYWLPPTSTCLLLTSTGFYWLPLVYFCNWKSWRDTAKRLWFLKSAYPNSLNNFTHLQ